MKTSGPNLKAVLEKRAFTTADLVGTWFIKRGGANEFKDLVHFLPGHSADIGGARYRSYRWEVKNNLLLMYYKENKEPSMEGRISAGDRIISVPTPKGSEFWYNYDGWTMRKISSDPDSDTDLFQVCGDKGTNEWRCVNKGKGESCYSSVPWEKTTSFHLDECKKQCKNLVIHRRKQAHNDTCEYE